MPARSTCLFGEAPASLRPDHADPAQDDGPDAIRRGLPLPVRQRLAAVQGLDLMTEIGVVLRRRPEHVEQVPRIDRGHPALVDPALDRADPARRPVPERGLEIVLDDRRAVHHLVRPDLRSERVATGNLHLGVDIGADPLGRAGGVVEHLRRAQPDLENLLHDLAVELLLRREVVVQVRLGQAGHVGDELHRRAAIARLGEDLLGSRKDHPLIFPADRFSLGRAVCRVHPGRDFR